jgi:hypothetical protein
VIDLTQSVDMFEFEQIYSDAVQRTLAPSSDGTGIHWQVSQAKSLMNIVINMSTAPDTAHQGESLTVCRYHPDCIVGLVMENGK